MSNPESWNFIGEDSTPEGDLADIGQAGSSGEGRHVLADAGWWAPGLGSRVLDSSVFNILLSHNQEQQRGSQSVEGISLL